MSQILGLGLAGRYKGLGRWYRVDRDDAITEGGVERGAVSDVGRVVVGQCLEVLRAAWGVEHRIIGGIWEVDWGKTWVVEEPYDVASGDVGELLDLPSNKEP